MNYNQRSFLSVFLLSMLLFLTACSVPTQMMSPIGVSPLSTEQEMPSGPDVCALSFQGTVPTPAPGKAALTGVLYTITGGGVIPGTRFYLTPVLDVTNLELPSVLGEPDPLKGQIEGMSDIRGYFELTEVPPGNYYIAVWAPYNWLIVFESDNRTPWVIHVEAGDRRALGCVSLAWP